MTPCSKCECSNTPKYKRTRNGIIKMARFCILCQREEQRIRYERVRNNPKQYQLLLKLNKEWQKRNKSAVSYYLKQWENKNKDKRRAQKQEYYILNKEKILKNNKAWKDANRKLKRKSNRSHIWRHHERARINEIIAKNLH